MYLLSLVKKMAAVLTFNTVDYKSDNKIIFIAALPKSGTTWLMQLFAEIPGFVEYIPPHITPTDNNINSESFSNIAAQKVVIKLHTQGTPEHVAILRKNKIKYCIMYRDLRDVTVSYCHYVKYVNKVHPYHTVLKELDIAEAITWFIENTNTQGDSLCLYVDWLNGWLRNRDLSNSILLKYEDMSKYPSLEFKRVVQFYNIDIEETQLQTIIDKHDFSKVSGRNPGDEDKASFARKGIVGDWKNYFTDENKQKFKEIAGDLLIQLNYEKNLEW